jgi:tetratricopeptide (TPR) repeat protein
MMKELADRSGATPDDMMSYAENLLDCPLKQLQNPAAAVTYARKAVELTNESVPDYLEQLARAYFETGNAEAAVRFEQKAVSILAPSAARKSAEELLGRFQSALRQK